MIKSIPNQKPPIIETLQLLASKDRQLAYEKNVPHVDITVELVCMWFNDQYHPGDVFFISCFTPDELTALAQFHQLYKECSRKLPESRGTIRTWLASPEWRKVMREAEKTLKHLGQQSAY